MDNDSTRGCEGRLDGRFVLTHDDAANLARACVSRAQGQPVAIAVTDAAGGVLYARRSRLMHPVIAQLTIAKAFTSATFGLPRHAIEQWQREKPWLHVALSQFGRYPTAPMPGSAEIRLHDTVIGGLGVTTYGTMEDQQLCDEVLSSFGYTQADGAPLRPGGPTSTAYALDVRGVEPVVALTDAVADQLVDAAIALATTLGRSVAVAVVDEYGAPLCVWRSHTAATTVDLAIAKAYTTVVTKHRTVELEDWQQEWPVRVAQLGQLGPYPLIVDFGGTPVMENDVLIGGMGVSGARGEEDQQICEDVLRRAGLCPPTTRPATVSI